MRRSLTFLASFLFLALSLGTVRPDFIREPMIIGFDTNAAYEYRQLGKYWNSEGRPVDLMKFMSFHGLSWVRLCITTNVTGSMSLAQALQTIRWAREGALMTYISFYLSSTFADFGKQPAPIGWEGKTAQERAVLAGEHTRSVVTSLLLENASDHLYEVGNEVDYGVCGSFVSDPGRWAETSENIEFLKSGVWEEEAIILKGAIEGVKSADPQAKIVVHLAHWWSLEFCEEFFKFMRDRGVMFDYVGLSYYPSSGIYYIDPTLGPEWHRDADNSSQAFRRTVMGLISHGYEVVMCEFAYPCTPYITGPFSSFNKELSGYPLTPEGQRKFIVDTLDWLYDQQRVLGAFYYAPAFYKTSLADVWGAFALFDERGDVRPGAFAVANFTGTKSELIAQTDARVALMEAWDAIDIARSEGRTEGLSEANQKVEEAWSSYLSGMFGKATRLSLEAEADAIAAKNPLIRGIFTVGAVVLGLALLIGIGAVVFALISRSKRSRSRKPPTGSQT